MNRRISRMMGNLEALERDFAEQEDNIQDLMERLEEAESDKLSRFPVTLLRNIKRKADKMTRREFSDILPESCSWTDWDQKKREYEFKNFRRNPIAWLEKIDSIDAAEAVWKHLSGHDPYDREEVVKKTIDVIADKLLDISLEHARQYEEDSDKSVVLYEGVRLSRIIKDRKNTIIKDVLNGEE